MFTTTTPTTSILRRLGVPVAVAALALTACGGSDDDAGDGGESATESDDGGSDGDGGDSAAESDDGGGAVFSESESGDDSSGDDQSGEGSNDEAQEAFDDAGVDLDLDELEETATALSTGDGGGVVTINGDAYTFEAQICIAQGPSFAAEGLAAAPDGTPAWVSISYSNDFDFDGDGENDETLDVFVEVGKTELFGSGPDDQPDWAATAISGPLNTGEDITFEFSGNSISGSGPMNDYNFVALEPGETAPMTFEASCS